MQKITTGIWYEPVLKDACELWAKFLLSPRGIDHCGMPKEVFKSLIGETDDSNLSLQLGESAEDREKTLEKMYC